MNEFVYDVSGVAVLLEEVSEKGKFNVKADP